jgi:hypothetical protein
MNLLQRIFGAKQIAAMKAALAALIDKEVDVIFDHNGPEIIEAKLVEWLSGPIGRSLLGQMGLAAALEELDAILRRNYTDKGRRAVKEWLKGRLGVNR